MRFISSALDGMNNVSTKNR